MNPSLPILARLWLEVVPDLADWALLCRPLGVKCAGILCLQSAMHKAAACEEAVRQAGLAEPPPLAEPVAAILAEMADAGSAQQYFASIILFWDPFMEHMAQTTSAATDHPSLAGPAIAASESQAILRLLGLSGEEMASAQRWAGHLADIVAGAGGIHAAQDQGAARPEAYRFSASLPPLDVAFFTWREALDKPPAAASQAMLAVLMALLHVMEDWWAEETSREEQIKAVTAAIDGFLDQAGPLLVSPTPAAREISASAFQQFRQKAPRQRLSDLRK